MPLNIPVISDPQAPQAVNPLPFVSEYLNRQQQQQQFNTNLVGEGAKFFNLLKQQKIQNALEAQKAKGEAFGQGGPYLMNMLYGNQMNAAGSTSLPPGLSLTPPQQQQPSQPAVSETPMPAPSEHIGNSLAMGHPQSGGIDYAPYQQNQSTPGMSSSQDAYLASLGLKPNQVGELGGMGGFGVKTLGGLKVMGDLEQQPLQTQKLRNDLALAPIDAAQKQQTLANSQSAVPMEVGSKEAEQQNKYQLPAVKIQSAMGKLQDLMTAYNAVPNSLKGSLVGMATSKVGSAGGKMAPEVVKYNKLRDEAIATLAAAKQPENTRISPEDIKQISKTFPSLADDPKVALDSIRGAFNEMQRLHDLNTQSAQSAASKFGGKITPMPTMYLQTATGPNGHKIGSNDGSAWFDAQTGKRIQ
jgi:hypothetical protein